MHGRRHSGKNLHFRNTHGSRTHAWTAGDGSASSMMAEDMASEDHLRTQQAQHRGIVAVSGPAAADGYSREGSHVGGRSNGGGYMDPVQDAAQALLGGMATSTSVGGNGFHHSTRGVGNSAQSGGSGGQYRPPNTPPSDVKGHGEDPSMLRGVGDWIKKSRRWVNSYWSRVARLQRERSRRMASNSTFLGDTDEGDSLREDGVGVGGQGPNGPMPRSQSSIFVRRGGASQPGRTGQVKGTSTANELELANMEGGNGVAGGVLDGEGSEAGGEVVALLGREVGNGESAAASLRRDGRMRVSTGDLVRLVREEGQEAGEDSAQEDRERHNGAGGSQGTGSASRFRWGLGPSRSLLWRQQHQRRQQHSLEHCSTDLEQWRREQWSERNFKVLGVEIGHLPESQQFFVCAGGVFTFLLVYGYMQEYLVVGIFHRELGLFLTLLQFFGYAACAALRRSLHNESERKIPLRSYLGLGFLQACMQGLTNVSMMFLNYPAKVLFKSSRMVPIMCFGVVWQGRKYSRRDYTVVFLIVTGLATFMNAETRASEDSETPFSVLGVICISMALVIDAAIINIQEELMNRYDSCQDELIMFSYLCGTVYIALACLVTGDLQQGVVFMHHQGMCAVFAVMLFAGAGFLGVSCVAALTKRFGALHSAITTTARKAVTLMLSFVVFPNKPFSVQHGVGAAVFIIGLVTKATGKRSKAHVPTGQSTSTSPGATPFVQTRGRKRLQSGKGDSDEFDTSPASPLISGTSGGPTCDGCSHGANGSEGDADRTHSPSPVGPEGSATVSDNSGGNPVRHRVTGITPNTGGAGVGAGDGNPGTGRGGRWVRRQPRATEGAVVDKRVSRSPLRRPQSPPVTGLGMSRLPV